MLYQRTEGVLKSLMKTLLILFVRFFKEHGANKIVSAGFRTIGIDFN